MDAIKYREDGRKINELRRTIIENIFPYTILRQGNSCVRVKIDGPKEGSKMYFHVNSDKKFQELYSIFCNITSTDSQLDIYIDIIEEDGSILSTIINCIVLNMCLSNIPILDFPCSISYSCKGVDLIASEEIGSKVTVVYFMNSLQLIYYKVEGKFTIEKLKSVDEMGKAAVKELYDDLKCQILKRFS